MQLQLNEMHTFKYSFQERKPKGQLYNLDINRLEKEKQIKWKISFHWKVTFQNKMINMSTKKNIRPRQKIKNFKSQKLIPGKH